VRDALGQPVIDEFLARLTKGQWSKVRESLREQAIEQLEKKYEGRALR